MSLYARSDISAVSVSPSHGGCGVSHSRPAPGGQPDPVWKLDCVPCEAHLRSDPLWSVTLSDVPETPDEASAREDFEKRRVFDQQGVMAMAMAKMAGIELPETLRRPLSGLAPHIQITSGQVECAAGHGNEPGSKYCAECGSLMRAAVLLCPNGHETAVTAKFCAECGAAMTPVAADARVLESPAAPAEPARKVRLRDARLDELQQIARGRGLDDSGTRADLLGRLRDAA